MPVSRRDTLRLGSGGALALLIGGGAGWLDRRDDTTTDPRPGVPGSTAAPSTTSTTAAPVVIAELPNAIDPAIITLGERVIAVTGEDDLASLLAALPGASDDPLLDAAAVVREDFAAGRTVDVDGWVLAVSEARAAAVVTLLCADTTC